MTNIGTAEDAITYAVTKLHPTDFASFILKWQLAPALLKDSFPDYITWLSSRPSSITDTALVDWLEKVEAEVVWNTPAEDGGTDFWSIEHVTGVKTIRELIRAEIEKEAGR